MASVPVAYIELPTTDVAAVKQFYGSLFGWTFQDFGPDYAAFSEGLEGGFNSDPESRTAAALVVLRSENIDATARQIAEQGGVITMPIFAYPGGRRFHFKDPAGNELAVMQPD